MYLRIDLRQSTFLSIKDKLYPDGHTSVSDVMLAAKFVSWKKNVFIAHPSPLKYVMPLPLTVFPRIGSLPNLCNPFLLAGLISFHTIWLATPFTPSSPSLTSDSHSRMHRIICSSHQLLPVLLQSRGSLQILCYHSAARTSHD